MQNSFKRILVVDDNKDAASSLAELLTIVGHEVKVAYDGNSAIRVASEFVPEVILLDIGLPDITGFEVTVQLRGRPQLHSTKLIALTGYSHAMALNDTRAAGFDHHLVKPVDVSYLVQLLQSL